MDKILFVNSLLSFRKEAVPLGILSLATILKNENYSVDIIDFSTLFNNGKLCKDSSLDENLNTMSSIIMDYNPKIVSLYTMCNSYHTSILLARKLKQRSEDITIILGGPQASLTAEASLKAFPWIDIVGIGEGERSIVNLVNAIFENKSLKDVNGIAYRYGENVIRNKDEDLIENLDELPMIDYSFIDFTGLKSIALDVGRGCPFGCTYCSTKTFWKQKFRLKSAERLVTEIETLTKYNINNFSFVHDLFTANKKKIIDFCKLLINKKLNVEWSCSARADTLDEELIEYLKLAGCNTIFLGIESGSPRMQKLMNKNLNLNHALKIIKSLKDHNFHLTTSFIYGFPDEALEDVTQTLAFIHKLKNLGVDVIQLHLLSVYPGTEIYENVKDRLTLCDTFSDSCETENLSEWIDELVVPNKDVFCYYYTFKSALRDHLVYLDKFIATLYERIFNRFNATYNLLMNYYEDDLLSMFLDFRNINTHELTKTFEENNLAYINNVQFISMLGKFVNEKNFGELDIPIKEMFKFEEDIINFMYYSEEAHTIKTYNLDVYTTKMSKNEVIPKEKNTKLNFKRVDNENIKITNIA